MPLDKSYNDNQNSDQTPKITKKFPSETESPQIYDSTDLLKGHREIIIRHHGEVYRLRLTRNDKLILNK